MKEHPLVFPIMTYEFYSLSKSYLVPHQLTKNTIEEILPKEAVYQEDLMTVRIGLEFC